MQRLSTCLLAIALASAAASAARGDDDAPKGDLAKIQGSWTTLVGPDKNIPMVVTIKGREVQLAVSLPNGDEIMLKGEMKLDENARPHKTLDWFRFTRPDGEPVQDNPGIYKIEADQITICSGGPGKTRPTEFRAAPEGEQYPSLIVLKRKSD